MKENIGGNTRKKILLCGCVLLAVLMYIRCFYGVDITDESFYVADAKAMLNGNVPYAYCNYSLASGAAFLMIPQLFMYGKIFPELQGVVLFMRLSYTTLRLLVLFISYRILKKYISDTSALLAVACMIPFWGSVVQNYSYNSIPTVLVFLCAVILYDVAQQEGKHPLWKLFLTGFLMAIAILAHPVYVVALLLFFALLFIDTQPKKRGAHIVAFCAGGLLELLIVFVPIICQVGIATLLRGLNRYIHPFASQSLTQSTAASRLEELVGLAWPAIRNGVLTAIVVLVLCLILFRKLHKVKYRLYALSASVIAAVWGSLFYIWNNFNGYDRLCMLGVLVSCGVVAYVVLRPGKKRLLLYLGIYPTLFAVLESVATGSNPALSRFYYTIPALCALVAIGKESHERSLRIVTVCVAVTSVVVMTVTGWQYVYRDAPIAELDTVVQSGVYAGLRTTEQRAHDLPELEQYLNTLVEPDDFYAFRDNVPAGYLMMHKGKMCDIATWDCLQYSYGVNAPAKLFDYYSRRDQIPDKIIYVDYGRDEQLSIEDPMFHYNDFVNRYYEQTQELSLNETFFQVRVYQYKGGFDKNYDAWVKTYDPLR